MRRAFEKIADMVQQGATHRHGWQLRDATPVIAAKNLKNEVNELADAVAAGESAERQLEEIADSLAILFHHSMMLGYGPDEVEQKVVDKLDLRFSVEQTPGVE